MDTKRLLLPLLVLVIAVAGGALWLVRSGAENDELGGGGALSGPLGRKIETPALAGAESDGSTARDVIGPEVAPAAADFGPDARLVEVRLAVPMNTPPDETLAVLGYLPAALEGVPVDANLPVWMQGMTRRATAAEYERVLAARGGRFSKATFENGVARVLFPRDATDVRLVIDGRYLYLEQPHALDLDEHSGTLLLEPQLGAWITGSLTLSGSGDAAALVGELALQGSSMGGARRGRAAMARSRAAIDGKAFEFRGLTAGLLWSLTPEVQEHFGVARIGFELLPGQHLELALDVLRGARLSGRVVDPAGAAVGGVELAVGGETAMWGGPPALTTTSAADGSWTLAGVQPGTRTVSATAAGWQTTESAALELEDGARRDDLVLVLDAGASLTGSVQWPDGSPAADARLDVIAVEGGARRGPFGGPRPQRVGGGRSNAQGKFHITGLGEGSFTLRATRNERGASADSGDVPVWRAVLQALAPNAKGLELTLDGPLAFAGRVVDDRGEPVTAFHVLVEPSGGNLAGEGQIEEVDSFEDEQGRFTFARVGAGEWSVQVTAEGHADPEPLPVKLPRTGDPLTITLQRQGRISGLVSDAGGTPIPGAWVEVGAGAAAGPFGAGALNSRGVETDDAGRFELRDLEPGGAELVAEADGWAKSAALPVDVPAGGVIEDLVLTLRVGGRITGNVYDEAGDPLSGRNVSYGNNAMGFGAEASATSDSAGGFAFERVTPGKWNVTASPSMAEMTERMAGGADESAWMQMMGELLTESVVVEDEAEVHVNLGGDPKIPVKVSGQVLRAGVPVEGATVSAVSEGSAIFQGMKSSRSGPDGRYELIVDRPDRYVISSRGANGAFAEAAVDVPEVEEFRIDLIVPEGRIAGLVKLPDGSPAENLRLDIQAETAVSFRFDGNQATTRSDGSYAFEALPAGRFSVRAATAGWAGPGGGNDDEPWGVQIRTGIDVAKDATTGGIDFTLTRAGAIKGKVIGPDGAAVSGVTIFVRDASGNVVAPVSRAVTDATGSFRHGRLAPGSYTVSARGDRVASGASETVVVREAEDSEVEVRVEPSTILLVSIKDPEGELLRARLEVLDENGHEVSQVLTMAMLQTFFNEGFSTTEQRVGPVPPGKYTVIATLRDGERIEKKVTVRGKEEQAVRLKLKE